MALTVNQVGAVLAAAALIAVIVLGVHYREAAKSAKMTDHVSTQVPAKPTAKVTAKPGRTYRKVLKGGKLDGRIGCRHVPKIANEFDRAQILAGAAQYGLSPEQLSALRVCLN